MYDIIVYPFLVLIHDIILDIIISFVIMSDVTKTIINTFLALPQYDFCHDTISKSCKIYPDIHVISLVLFICCCIWFHWLMISVPYDILQYHDILDLIMAPALLDDEGWSSESSGWVWQVNWGLNTERLDPAHGLVAVEAAQVKKLSQRVVVEKGRLSRVVQVASATWNLKHQTGTGTSA